MNTKKRNRLIFVISLFVAIAFGIFLILWNLKDNIVFFYPPSEIHKIQNAKTKVRVGGLVQENSIVTLAPNKIRFIITDNKNTLVIEYTGVLPVLFREKQGIVAEGVMINDVFVTTKLLAKHDENYMPPEVKKAI